MDGALVPILAVVGFYLFSGLRVLREYERAVYFFLGRSWGSKGPGLIYLPPLFARMQKVSLRVVALDIPPQDVITRDNISIKVNAVLYMRVIDPVKAVIGVENYLYATRSERAVYFFLGRSWGSKGPGLIYLPPLFARMQKVSLRVVALDIPPQDVITRDNISIKVNAVLYMRVIDPVKAVIGVENYLYATSQLAQ